MTIEVALLFSGCSVLIALIFGISNWKRANKQDTKSDTTQLTTVIVNLETIKDGISEIKSDIKNTKNDVQDLRERMAKNESSITSAHKRIDELSK